MRVNTTPDNATRDFAARPQTLPEVPAQGGTWDTQRRDAVVQGHVHALTPLLAQPGTPIAEPLPGGSTLLHTAVEHHQNAMAQHLLEHGADALRLDANGASPLHRACEHWSEAAFEWLMDRPEILRGEGRHRNVAELLNRPRNNGQALLHLAARAANSEIVESLLDRKGIDVCATDHEGWSALYEAVVDERAAQQSG